MTPAMKNTLLFAAMALLILVTALFQSLDYALSIVMFGLISAIMSLGVNIQWGYAGLFNIGVMGFVALGGVAAVLVSMPVTEGAWSAGGYRIVTALVIGVATIMAAAAVFATMAKGRKRGFAVLAVIIVGFLIYRYVFDAGVEAVEDINPASTGYLGGLGLPVILAWPLGGILAAGAAWVIGKTALGLRSDYLAIATLGISEIIIAVIKNEDWLTRGVKNVIGVPRPVPYEVDLQADPAFVDRAAGLGLDPVAASTLYVKVAYCALFLVILLAILWLAQRALYSPWGRMVRAIRDNEVAAEAMGKDVKARHLQIFILGSAVLGIAGAMLVSTTGILNPGEYQPLRYTFLIWVMVIVGGSGNNFGAVLGGMLIWWLWNLVEPGGKWLLDMVTSPMPDAWYIKSHLQAASEHMRLFTMGLVLLLVLRFAPRGLIPER